MATVKQLRDAPYGHIAYLLQIQPARSQDPMAPVLYLADRNIVDETGQRYEAYIISCSGSDTSINTFTGQVYNASFNIIFDNAPIWGYNHLIEIPYSWNCATCKIYEIHIDKDDNITSDKYLIFDGILDEPRSITKKTFACTASSITMKYDMQFTSKQKQYDSTGVISHLPDGIKYAPIVYGSPPLYKGVKGDWGLRTALESSVDASTDKLVISHPATSLGSTVILIDNEVVSYATYSGSTLSGCQRAYIELNSSGQRVGSSAVPHGRGAIISEWRSTGYPVMIAGHEIYGNGAASTLYAEIDSRLVKITTGFNIAYYSATSPDYSGATGTFALLTNRLVINPKDAISLTSTKHTHEYAAGTLTTAFYAISSGAAKGNATYGPSTWGSFEMQTPSNMFDTTDYSCVANTFSTFKGSDVFGEVKNTGFWIKNKTQWSPTPAADVLVKNVYLNIVMYYITNFQTCNFKIYVNNTTEAFREITHANFNDGGPMTTFETSITWDDKYENNWSWSTWQILVQTTMHSGGSPKIFPAGAYYRIQYQTVGVGDALIDKEGYVVNANHVDNIWVGTKGYADTAGSVFSTSGATGSLITQGFFQIKHFLNKVCGYSTAYFDWSELPASTRMTNDFVILDKINPTEFVQNLGRENMLVPFFQAPNTAVTIGKWNFLKLYDTTASITSVATITDDDLLEGTDFEFDYSDLADIANEVNLHTMKDYIDVPVDGASTYGFTVTDKDGTSTAIYGDLSTSITLQYLKSSIGSTILSDFYLRQKRLPRLIVRFQSYWQNFKLNVGDVFTLSYSLFNGKQFIIESINRDDTHRCTITAREYWS